MQNPKVSGTIMPDKLNKLAIKGIQFTGEVLDQNDPFCKNASRLYYSRHPLAVSAPGIVWTIQLHRLKMTDNYPGIFKNHNWQRDETKISQPD
jgi:uncharacterized protein YhbP (UPF0306 family)